MREPLWRGAANRLFQLLARVLPGATSLRVRLHRWRGVRIAKNVWIGYDAIIETSRPYLVTIEDDVSIGMRVTIIAHFKESCGVKIEREAFIGPGVIILPGVVIGHGAVVAAGSVVTRSVPARTVVQGNPAVPVANCNVPLSRNITLKQFSKNVKPLLPSGRRFEQD